MAGSLPAGHLLIRGRFVCSANASVGPCALHLLIPGQLPSSPPFHFSQRFLDARPDPFGLKSIVTKSYLRFQFLKLTIEMLLINWI